jgi:2-dehydro-3-deoxyphosphooctonate aldolase (KDO 8-P synthase)
MVQTEVNVAGVRIGKGKPLALIAGPCVLEGEEMALKIATTLQEWTARRDIPFIFKASFDKANRTSLHSERGPGLVEGLEILAKVKQTCGVPITTDVHLPSQAKDVAQVADLLQVPAFLCRQTDLLLACAATGRPVNLKKGQFMAPSAMAPAVEKLQASPGVLITERGTMFGYGDLVVDMRSIAELHALGLPVVFDATHSVQRPGGMGTRTTADRHHVPALGRAAIAAGADAVFAEVHPDPAAALSDADSQWPLSELPDLLDSWWRVARVLRDRAEPQAT